MYTELEKKIFNVIASTSMDGSVADIKDVTEETGVYAGVARGVISSLVKKGKIYVEECNLNGVKTIFYWPIYGDCNGGFLCDYFDRSEMTSILL